MRGGEPKKKRLEDELRNISPTCVGVNRYGLPLEPEKRHIPHMRGGEPLSLTLERYKR